MPVGLEPGRVYVHTVGDPCDPNGTSPPFAFRVPSAFLPGPGAAPNATGLRLAVVSAGRPC